MDLSKSRYLNYNMNTDEEAVFIPQPDDHVCPECREEDDEECDTDYYDDDDHSNCGCAEEQTLVIDVPPTAAPQPLEDTAPIKMEGVAPLAPEDGAPANPMPDGSPPTPPSSLADAHPPSFIPIPDGSPPTPSNPTESPAATPVIEKMNSPPPSSKSPVTSPESPASSPPPSRNKRIREEEDYVPNPPKRNKTINFLGLLYQNNPIYHNHVDKMSPDLEWSYDCWTKASSVYECIFMSLINSLNSKYKVVGKISKDYRNVGATKTLGYNKKYRYVEHIDTCMAVINNLLCNPNLNENQFSSNIMLALTHNIWFMSSNGYIFVEPMDCGNVTVGCVIAYETICSFVVTEKDLVAMSRVFVNDLTQRRIKMIDTGM